MTTAFGTVWRFSVSTRPDQRGIGSHRSVVVVAADLPTRPLARSLIIRLPVRSSLRSAIEVTQARTKASGWSVRPSAVHVATSSVQSCDRLHESRPSLPRHSAKSMSQSPFLLFLSSSRPRRPPRPPVDSDDPPSFSTGVQSPPLSPSCLRSPYLALPASHPPSFLPLNSLGRLIW